MENGQYNTDSKTAFVYHTNPLKRYLHGGLTINLYWFNALYGENKGYSMTRYQHLANLLAERIEQGLYRSGERLPSVRTLSQEHGVSISTIQQAYQILENLQLITP